MKLLKPSRLKSVVFILGAAFLASGSQAALTREGGVYLMPLNCNELLPDSAPFTTFLEAVGHGLAGNDKPLARKIFRILKIRDKLRASVDMSKGPNPVDTLVQKTICFYREKKDALRPITFDDADFVQFMKVSIRDLETKVDDTVYQREFEKFQRLEFERRAQRNKVAVEKLQAEAERDAEHSYEKISDSARRKVQQLQ